MAPRNDLGLKHPDLFLRGFHKSVFPKLWRHQKQAINYIARYLRNPLNKDRYGSRLISLPTGSGKSGIIACCTRFVKTPGITLIVTPRKALRDQLAADMCAHYRKGEFSSGRFFEHVGVSLAENNIPKSIFLIQTTSDLAAAIDSDADHKTDLVIICTIQLLTHIWKKAGAMPSQYEEENKEVLNDYYLTIFNKLHKNIGLLIFDEGHYEPAPSWAQVVRSVSAKKLIFTATAFRQDFRAFDWDPQDVLFIPFAEMANKFKRIRDVKVEKISGSQFGLTQVLQTLERKRKELAAEFNEPVEVIIRVASRARILEVCDTLVNERIATTSEIRAIHDRPQKEGDGFPVGIEEDYEIDDDGPIKYWVHQKKLLEGIDRPQISIVFMLDKLSNMRAFVQQIGRVTRKFYKRKSRPFALILDTNGNSVEFWNEYLRFENGLKTYGFRSQNAESLVSAMFGGLQTGTSPTVYIQDRPRGILIPTISKTPNEDSDSDLDGPWTAGMEIDFNNDCVVQNSAQILIIDDPTQNNWRKIKDRSVRELQNSYYSNWRISPTKNKNGAVDSGNILVVLSIAALISPHLLRHAFFDLKLEILVLYRTGKYLFVYDSSGRSYLKLFSQFTTMPSPTRLLRQLPAFDDQRIRSISVTNSRRFKGTLTSKTENAIDITTIPTSLDNPNLVVSSAKGYAQYTERDPRVEGMDLTAEEIKRGVPPFARRISISSRKITDYGKRVPISAFCSWADKLASNLELPLSAEDNTQQVTYTLFDRYAYEVPAPAKGWEPKYLYLDLAEFEGDYVKIIKGMTEEETSFPILEDGLVELEDKPSFSGMLKFTDSSAQVPVRAIYNESKKSYAIESDVLDTYRPKAYAKAGESTLLQILNQEQRFSIQPIDGNYFYSLGAFYKPGIRFGKDYKDEQTGLLQIVHKISELEFIRTEKGEKGSIAQNSKTWPQNSLFGIIDAAGQHRSLAGDPKNIVEGLKTHLGKINWLVCDDMGPERADFLVLSEKSGDPHIILIHAKAVGKGAASKLSSKNLSDVCMQAIRSLEFFGPKLNLNFSKLEDIWVRDKENEPTKIRRIRSFPKRIPRKRDGDYHYLRDEATKDFKNAISNPSVKREIWLVTGGILSYSKLEKTLHTENPSITLLPAIYSLFATSSTVAQYGARLRVFSY